MLVFGSASALAQDGDLTDVTMRVLDDVSDVDAVVLELDANRGEGEEGAASDAGADEAATQQMPTSARREAATGDATEHATLRRERDELHESTSTSATKAGSRIATSSGLPCRRRRVP